MHEFSLSRARDKVLPESVTDSQGNVFSIDADFRTVLRCMRVLNDPNVSLNDKAYLLMIWFFKEAFVPEAFTLFADFISSSENSGDNGPSLMDYEQDADAIYASFWREYGMDLLEVQWLHWYKFCALMSGLSDQSALAARMKLRDMDTSHLKGKEKAKADRAKRRVALKERISAEELAIQDELQRALAAGEDPAPILARIRAMGGE